VLISDMIKSVSKIIISDDDLVVPSK